MSTSLDIKKDGLALLRLTVDEEHHYIESFSRARAFYAGAVAAILAVAGNTLVGAESLTEHVFAASLVMIGFAFAVNAPLACDRYYARFLEAIRMRALLEYRLGMLGSNDQTLHSDAWFATEDLVHSRYLEGRASLARRTSEGLKAKIRRAFSRPSVLPVTSPVLERLAAWQRHEEHDEWRLGKKELGQLSSDAKRLVRLRNSKEFIDDKMPLGDNLITRWLFFWLRLLCVGVFALTIASAISQQLSAGEAVPSAERPQTVKE